MSKQFKQVEENFKVNEVVLVDTKEVELHYKNANVYYNGEHCKYGCLILKKWYTCNRCFYEVIDAKLKDNSLIFIISEKFISKK